MLRDAPAQKVDSGRPALLQAVIDAMRIPDLRYRILFTLGILIIFRFLAHVPVPGVDRAALSAAFDANPILGFLDLFSGGALRNLSIAALGVYPYITASIIIQVLTPIVPSLKALSQEGDYGRQKINQYTHYLTVPLAFMQGYGQLNLLSSTFTTSQGAAISGIGFGDNTLNTITILTAMTAGTMLLVWMGELITEKGIGNGISLIIFAGIVTAFPGIFGQLWLLRDQLFQVLILVSIGLVTIYLIVFFNEAQRRIPVQYGRSVFRGGRMYRQAGSSFIPLRVNSAGMIPLIFAFSLLILPAYLAKLLRQSGEQRDRRGDRELLRNEPWTGERVLLGRCVPPGCDLYVLLHPGGVQSAKPCRKSAKERRVRPRNTAWQTDPRIPDEGHSPYYLGRRLVPRVHRHHPVYCRAGFRTRCSDKHH